MLELWGMQSAPSLPSPRSTLTWNGNTWLGPIYGSNRTKLHTYAKLNCLKWNYLCMLNLVVWNRTVFDIETVLTLNWIVWNRTVLTFKLRTYDKLNCLKWNCFCMLNWIVWNRTVFDIETVLMLNWIVWTTF